MSNLDSETEFSTKEIEELSKFSVKVCEKAQTFQLEQLQLSVCSKACASNIREIMCCSCYFQKKFREKEGKKIWVTLLRTNSFVHIAMFKLTKGVRDVMKPFTVVGNIKNCIGENTRTNAVHLK